MVKRVQIKNESHGRADIDSYTGHRLLIEPSKSVYTSEIATQATRSYYSKFAKLNLKYLETEVSSQSFELDYALPRLDFSESPLYKNPNDNKEEIDKPVEDEKNEDTDIEEGSEEDNLEEDSEDDSDEIDEDDIDEDDSDEIEEDDIDEDDIDEDDSDDEEDLEEEDLDAEKDEEENIEKEILSKHGRKRTKGH